MTYKCLLFTLFGWLSVFSAMAQVGIGTPNAHPSAALEVQGDKRGFLPPRMTTAQRDSIINPAAGLMIFNTSLGSLEVFTGTGWGSVIIPSAYVRQMEGGNGDDQIEAVKPTLDGGFIIAGYTTSTNLPATPVGNGDIWVSKINNKGRQEWTKLLGTTSGDIGYDVIQTNDGGYLVAGYKNVPGEGSNMVLYKLSSGGATQWEKTYGGSQSDVLHRVIQSRFDNGFILVGYSRSGGTGTFAALTANGSNDGVIIKTDVQGNVLWQKMLGGSGNDELYSVCENNYGEIIAVGKSASSNTGTLAGVNSNGGIDVWLVKMYDNGSQQFQRLWGGSAEDGANDITMAQQGTYLITGYSQSSNTGTLAGITTKGSTDCWLIAFNDNGAIRWQKLLGGSAFDMGMSAVATPDYGFVVASVSSSSNNGNLAGLTGNGAADIWCMRLDANGNTLWQKLLGGTDSDNVRRVAICSDGTFVLCGTTSSSNSGIFTGITLKGASDGFLLKLDKYGNTY